MTPFCEKSALHNDSNDLVAKQVETIECATQTALFDGWNDHSSVNIHKPEQIFTNVAVIICMAIVFFIFFFGSIELEGGRILMPMFWKLTSNLISEPYTVFSITHDPPTVW